MITFEIDGRPINPDNFEDAMMAAILNQVRQEIQEKIGSIRDPETGAFPTVIVRGKSLDDLRLSVEGSPEIIAKVKERLGLEDDDEDETLAEEDMPPKAFLSYGFEDSALAERIAHALQANGIETWWAGWCITSGDSLRQKIDEGLSGCTHFLALLTPQSIDKPWVKQEMDAALVKKLRNECKFIPVRYDLSHEALPPLLSGLLSPEVTADVDITQLINDIHGITRKPPLGPKPQPISQAKETNTGYSPAANAVAKYFVENSKHGCFADPQTDIEPLAEATGLTIEDTKDALHELRDFVRDNHFHILPEASLYTEFDKYWMPWNPEEDALKLATDIANIKDFPATCQKIAERYDWSPRRLNPAIIYLEERGLLVEYKILGSAPFTSHRAVAKEDELRRFLKSRI